MPQFQLKDKEATRYTELDIFTQGYIEAMFFTDTGEDDEGMEDVGFNDLSKEALDSIHADCTDFQHRAKEYIKEENFNLKDTYNYIEMAGHDFWLTRQGHGCGFWDGDWKEPAAGKLTEFSEVYTEIYFYKGDNGKLYVQ